MEKKRQVSRREFMRLSAFTTAGAVLVACSGGAPAPAPAAPVATAAATTAPAAPTTPATAPTKFNEAPMLADLVKQSKLPAVDQRLPANPMVMPVIESTGKYGGTMRRGFNGVSDRWGPTKCQDHGMAWYDKDLNMRPRIAESWEINDDASEWTFHLRKDMKWSDGQPFTTADIKWWYDNELLNKDLNPAGGGLGSGQFASGPKNTVMTIEVVDDYTIKTKFADPNPLFINKLGRLSLSGTISGFYAPGHYMKQFHMELTDNKDALTAAVKKAGFETWDQYYTDRSSWYLNPDRPSVGPWLAKNQLSEQLFNMERNPYFFAVDADGNQLPYIDKITHRLYDTPDNFNLWIINGEIDFQNRHVDIGNFTLFKTNEEKGGFKGPGRRFCQSRGAPAKYDHQG